MRREPKTRLRLRRNVKFAICLLAGAFLVSAPTLLLRRRAQQVQEEGAGRAGGKSEAIESAWVHEAPMEGVMQRLELLSEKQVLRREGRDSKRAPYPHEVALSRDVVSLGNTSDDFKLLVAPPRIRMTACHVLTHKWEGGDGSQKGWKKSLHGGLC